MDRLGRIDFLVYSRATADSEHPAALDEAHWSYMDEYAGGMIARGPTLATDRETWTGSLHILDLPSAEAARAFAEHEPYNRAGLFAEHVIRRFENRLGRTMWEFEVASDEPRFLVLAHGGTWGSAPREGLIVGGTLLTPDGTTPAGIALVVQAPSREAVAALLPGDEAGVAVEIHDWEAGGRR